MANRICPECDTRCDGEVCPRCGTRTLFDEPSEPGFDPLLGRVFDGRYRLESLLGKGGMGVVYRGVQIAMGKVVAVKVLRGELAAHREAARRFHREAKAASLLSHPHTVRVFDFGQTRERELFMVMELLEGPTLGSVLNAEGRLPFERAIRVATEITEALMEAHAKGLVHRDLKPDNVILLDVPGHPDFVKVLDFGIAKLLTDSGQGSDVTRTGAVVGTPTYMAPEQSAGTRAVSPALDVYALGIMLYQLLAGNPPFGGNTPLEVLLAHASQPVPELPAALDVPPGLRALVGAMLAKDPSARPSTTQVFADLDTLRLRVLAGRLTEPAVELPPPVARRWPWLAIGLGCFALAFVLLALWRQPAAQVTAALEVTPEAVPPTPDAIATPDPGVVPAEPALDVVNEMREGKDTAASDTAPPVRPVPPRRAVKPPRRTEPVTRPPTDPAKPKYEPVW